MPTQLSIEKPKTMVFVRGKIDNNAIDYFTIVFVWTIILTEYT